MASEHSMPPTGASYTEGIVSENEADSFVGEPEPVEPSDEDRAHPDVEVIAKTEWLYYDVPADLRCVMYTCHNKIELQLPEGHTDWMGKYDETNGGAHITLEFQHPSTNTTIKRALWRHPQRRLEFWGSGGIHMKKVDTHIWLQDEMRWMSFWHEHRVITMQ